MAVNKTINKRTNTHGAMRNCIEYVLRQDKTSEQLAYVTNSEPGHGLLFFNNVILPFADDFPKDTELYKLLTTKPSEVAHETVDDEKEDQNG